MSKILKIILIAVPVLIIVIIITLGLSLNSIIKQGIETVGPRATGTEVKLAKADISILSGKGELRGFLIGNPEGFHAESAIKFDTVRMALDLSSVRSDKIIIEEIFIDGPEITYEKSGRSDNIKAILNNVKAFAGESKSAPQPEKGKKPEGAEKKLQINSLIIKNGKIHMSTTLLKGQKTTLPLEDIHLKDLGKDGKGTSMAQVMEIVLAAVNKNTVNAVADSVTSIGSTVEKSKEQLKGLKGLFGK
jgi:uncharacterized protein involved in outer membrane biogenesis